MTETEGLEVRWGSTDQSFWCLYFGGPIWTVKLWTSWAFVCNSRGKYRAANHTASILDEGLKKKNNRFKPAFTDLLATWEQLKVTQTWQTTQRP